MPTISHDLRLALRGFLKRPGFTAVAVFTLALGIAASSTVFTWIDGILLNPVAGVAHGGELACLQTIYPGGQSVLSSYRDLQDYRAHLTSISGISGFWQSTFSVGVAPNIQRVWGEAVTQDYFRVLGLRPSLGDFARFDDFSDAIGAHPVAVISHRLWQSRFNSDPAAIGKTIRVNRQELTLVAVAPPEYHGFAAGIAQDLWVPFTMAPTLGAVGDGALTGRSYRSLNIFVRRKTGVSVETASAEVKSEAARFSAAYPNESGGHSAALLPVWQAGYGAQDLLRTPLQILAAICALVLLIACANVANLLLARTVSRRKELGIRLALGAGRSCIVRQMLTETAVLAAAGALAALPVSLWLAESLSWLVPKVGISLALPGKANPQILMFTAALCFVSTLISGIPPTLLAFRAGVNDALRDSSRGTTAGRQSQIGRATLVAAEIALASVCLIGAGLFLRSFHNASRIHPGFEPNNVLLARVYPTGMGSDDTIRRAAELQHRLQSLAGIRSVAVADVIPLGFGFGPWTSVHVPGYQPARGENMGIFRSAVSPSYFATLRIPVMEGREFTSADSHGAPPVAIVNRAFARRYFRSETAVGRTIRFFDRNATVVGMVADSKRYSPAESPLPYLFIPVLSNYREGQELAFFLRTDGPPQDLIGAFHHELAAVDSNTPFDTTTLADYTTAALFPQRVAASFVSVLGGISLLLAASGLYSVMAYTVTQRTAEFGIRSALGAQPGDIIAQVFRGGFVITAAGLAVGLTLSAFLTRFAAPLLIRVSPNDPVTFLGTAVFLTLVATIALLLPARRATRASPLCALRAE